MLQRLCQTQLILEYTDFLFLCTSFLMLKRTKTTFHLSSSPHAFSSSSHCRLSDLPRPLLQSEQIRGPGPAKRTCMHICSFWHTVFCYLKKKKKKKKSRTCPQSDVLFRVSLIWIISAVSVEQETTLTMCSRLLIWVSVLSRSWSWYRFFLSSRRALLKPQGHRNHS